MSDNSVKHIFSPAKVNLYLHITGRTQEGYHELDSLVGFVDIGDDIAITPADHFRFHVEGPFSSSFQTKELDSSPSSSNIAVKAAWEISRALKKKLDVEITLTKNLPLAGGIGGGSANAAAVIWGLLDFWNVPPEEGIKADFLHDILINLGADVPVCLECAPARIRGIGEILDPAPLMDEMPIVLIHPGKPCETAKIFRHYLGEFRNPQTLPHDLRHFGDLVLFLRNQYNDLYFSACDLVPDIKDVLQSLESHKGCALARMSGSGSTCFGIFEDETDAQNAVREITEENPHWWVVHGHLNRPERY